MTFDPTNNLPPDFKEDKFYAQVNYSRAVRVKCKVPLTDAERIAQGEAFAIIDEYDKRNRGQQFEN
jgi:hypothetical protein